MVSIRFIGVAVLVATTVAVSATTSAPAFPTPPTAVARQAGDATVDLIEPEDLPIGDPPQVAYIDALTRDTPIYRPGKEPLAVGPGRLVRQLTQVRGGYVVTMSNLRRSWVQYVANDG